MNHGFMCYFSSTLMSPRNLHSNRVVVVSSYSGLLMKSYSLFLKLDESMGFCNEK